MRKNPFDAIDPAMSHTKKMLFGPWNFERWISLGMLCFLQTCAGIGMGDCSGGNFNLPFDAFEKLNQHDDSSSAVPTSTGQLYASLDDQPAEAPDDATGQDNVAPDNDNPFASGDESFDSMAESVKGFVRDNMALVWTLGAIVLLLFIVLTVLFQWLGARAVFAYIDNIATFRADVERPWSEHATLADSFFKWRLAIIAVQLVALAMIAVPMGLFAYRTVAEGGSDAWQTLLFSAPLWLGLGGLILLGLVGFLILAALYDVTAPIQFARRCDTGEAISLSLALIGNNIGAFLLYLLLKFLVAIAMTIVIVIVGFLTCCCGFIVMALPVLGQTLLQPLWVFHRTLSLYFVAGLEPQFDVMNRATPSATPQPAPAPFA